MSKWIEEKIGNIGEIVTGNTPPTKNQELYGDRYKFIKATDICEDSRTVIKTEEMLSDEGFKKYKKSLLPKGTTCVVTIGTLGKKLCYTDEPCFTNQAINAIKQYANYDSMFIYYQMKLLLPQVKFLSSGTASGRENVSKSSFSNIKMRFPDLPTQKRIADILSAYDDLIENNNKRIALLEKAAQELYKEWFVRFRFPSHENTKFVNGLPEGWEVKKVKELVKRLPFGILYKECDVNKEGKVIVIDQSRSEYIGFHNDKPSHIASIEQPIILFGDHSCKFQLMATPFSLSENVVPFVGKDGILSAYLYYVVKDLIETTEYKRHWTELGSKKVLITDSKLQNLFVENIGDSLILIEKLKLRNRNLIKQRDLTNGIFNTIDYIKKAIALYFRFSLIDENFNIYVNDELINESLLTDFSENTQFLWRINTINDPFVKSMNNLQEDITIESPFKIKGYIASAQKPSQLKIRGTQEKVTIDLFVNGRLREKDILRHIPTARIVENYVYGQIHFDSLDQGECKDVFTSSREGVISDDPAFTALLNELEKIFKLIIDQWDDFRRKHGETGDPDNLTITPKARKAQELFNTTLKDMQATDKFIKKGSVVEQWANELSSEAQFNVPSYTECFISENLLRRYVKHSGMAVTKEAKEEADKWRNKEQTNKAAANISYDVRVSNDDLYYLDMTYLSNLIDKVPADKPKTAGLSRSATIYKPMRDAVGHTSILTQIAKFQLTLEYENIKARLVQLLKEFESKK